MKKLLYVLMLLPIFAHAQAPTNSSSQIPGSSSFTATGWRNKDSTQIQVYNPAIGKYYQLVTGKQFNAYTGTRTQAQIDSIAAISPLKDSVLIKGKNLYDVPNKETALINLGVLDSITTKSLISARLASLNTNSYTILYSADFSSIGSEWVNNGWVTTAGGITPTSTGIDKYIELNKEYSLNKRFSEQKVTWGNGTRLLLSTRNITTVSTLGTAILLDGTNSVINIYRSYDCTNPVLPSIAVSMPYTFINGRDYTIKMVKDQFTNAVIVRDEVTMICDTLSEPNRNSGRQFDAYALSVLGGGLPVVKSFSVKTPFQTGVDMAYYGDSIFDGFYINESGDYAGPKLPGDTALRYTQMGMDNFQKAYLSGRGGGNIDGVIRKISTEIKILRPKAVEIMIGTNSGNTLTKLNQMVQAIQALGITVFLDKIPMRSDASVAARNADIASAWVTNGITGADMAAATSVNNASAVIDSSLFFIESNGVLLHPNKYGYQAMARFQRGVAGLYNNSNYSRLQASSTKEQLRLTYKTTGDSLAVYVDELGTANLKAKRFVLGDNIDTDTTQYSYFVNTRNTLTGFSNTSNVFIQKANRMIWNPASNSSQVIKGIESTLYKYGSSSTSNLQGIAGIVDNRGSGNVTVAIGVQGGIQNNGSGTIGNGRALYALSPVAAIGRPITNAPGVYIDPQKVAGVSNGYGIYQAGLADTNYFAGIIGIKTNSPTHALTLGSTANGIVNYNTANQTNAYERFRQYWNSNTYTLTTENSGAGTLRDIILQTGNSGRTLLVGATANVAGGIRATFNTGNGVGSQFGVGGTLSSSSAVGDIQTGLAVVPTVNQSNTAGYRGVWVGTYEQSTGSGLKMLFDGGTVSGAGGIGTYSRKFSVSSTGSIMSDALTPDRVNVSDGLKNIVSSAVTTTELNLLSGRTSLGTVTSITPGYGFTSATPITTIGTLTIDTASSLLSKANANTNFLKFSGTTKPLNMNNQNISNVNALTLNSGNYINSSGIFAFGRATLDVTNPTSHIDYRFVSNTGNIYYNRFTTTPGSISWNWGKAGSTWYFSIDSLGAYVSGNKVATLSDLGSYVTLGTPQTITAAKRFTFGLGINGAAPLTWHTDVSAFTNIELLNPTSNVTRLLKIPDASGTFALTSDLPTNYVTNNSNQINVNGNKQLNGVWGFGNFGNATDIMGGIGSIMKGDKNYAYFSLGRADGTVPGAVMALGVDTTNNFIIGTSPDRGINATITDIALRFDPAGGNMDLKGSFAATMALSTAIDNDFVQVDQTDSKTLVKRTKAEVISDLSGSGLAGYSEGTWTPTPNTAMGTSFTSASGSYIKTGNQVTAYFTFTVSANADGNDFEIRSLPFSNGSTAVGVMNLGRLVPPSYPGITRTLFGEVAISDNKVKVYDSNTGVLDYAAFSGYTMSGTITYRTN